MCTELLEAWQAALVKTLERRPMPQYDGHVCTSVASEGRVNTSLATKVLKLAVIAKINAKCTLETSRNISAVKC